jgi:hypothetical protein
MKSRKISLIIVTLLIISIPTWLVTKRLFLPKYVYNGNDLVYKNIVYVYENADNVADRNNLGKQIGIAMRKDSKITFIADLFFGDTVYEFKDDKEHNRIFVNVFMDGSGAYQKVSK